MESSSNRELCLSLACFRAQRDIHPSWSCQQPSHMDQKEGYPRGERGGSPHAGRSGGGHPSAPSQPDRKAESTEIPLAIPGPGSWLRAKVIGKCQGRGARTRCRKTNRRRRRRAAERSCRCRRCPGFRHLPAHRRWAPRDPSRTFSEVNAGDSLISEGNANTKVSQLQMCFSETDGSCPTGLSKALRGKLRNKP